MQNTTSVIDFPGNTRIHIGLAVRDVEQAKRFYETLFGQPPVKERPGYVKFEPQDPSVNLSLNQAEPGIVTRALPTHYGIQVKSTAAVQDAAERLRAAGLLPRMEDHTACCYAVQDKAWVTDPDGNQWEIFVVTDADSPHRKPAAAPGVESCCGEGAGCCG